jgi:hypothetical protein
VNIVGWGINHRGGTPRWATQLLRPAQIQTSADIVYLRERAAAFRRLSRQYGEADCPKIAEKLLSVAAELEAKADALEGLFSRRSKW